MKAKRILTWAVADGVPENALCQFKDCRTDASQAFTIVSIVNRHRLSIRVWYCSAHATKVVMTP